MRVVVLVLCVLVVGCIGGQLVSPVVRFGGGTSPSAAQRDLIRDHAPALLSAPEVWSGSVSTVRIRVWADDDYRAQNRRWRASFDELLAYANEVLAPAVGIRLVADHRDWSFRPGPGNTIDDVLGILRRHDRGDGVFAVVGLVSSLALVSSSFEALGTAELGGRHLVLRGHADVKERAMFERALPDVARDERDTLHEMRRRHKTTSVFLHELGHVLGVDHVVDVDTLMSAHYSHRAASFDARSRATMIAAIDARLGRARTAAAHAAAHPTLVIRIDASGTIFVGDVPIRIATVRELLRLSFEDDPLTDVVIDAHRAAPVGVIRDVYGLAHAAGLRPHAP
jgi:hypothetical protein